MEYKNIRLSLKLKEDLVSAYKNYNRLNKAFKRNSDICPEKVRISIGGDQSGNNKIKDVVLNLNDSVDGKRILAKLRSEAWGVIVNIRCTLRSLGVELETEQQA